MDAVTCELLVSADRVMEVGVPAVNDCVSLGEEWDQFVDHRLGCVTARHHHPDTSRGGECRNEVLHRVGGGCAILGDLVSLLARAIPDRHLVSTTKEALHHVAAHLP